MKTNSRHTTPLALTALAAITVYILACGTAFSPDDSKVLYSTIDAKTGAIGVAAYDRTTGKSEMLFLPMFQDLDTLKTGPVILRPQWLPDGKSVLVAWPGVAGSKNNDGLTLAVLPFGGAGPVKLFFLPEIEEPAQLLQRPLPIAGHFLFLTRDGESNTTSIIRLDLLTGEMRNQTNLPSLKLLPAPHGDGVIYLAELPGDDERGEVGFLNPDTFARMPVFPMSADLPVPDFDDMKGFLAISRDGKRFAFTDTADGKPVCRVLQNGKPFKTVPLPESEKKLSFGNAQFAPDGEMVYISFLDRGAGGTNASFGVFELPLNGSALRRNTLIQDCGVKDDSFALYFQLDVSNDGRTLAVASTYLAYENDGGSRQLKKPEDCALFLLNLADPQRKVTRVPVPLPPLDLLNK